MRSKTCKEKRAALHSTGAAIKRSKSNDRKDKGRGGMHRQIIYEQSAPEFGPNWIVRGYRREGGVNKGCVDRYWFSPVKRIKFIVKSDVEKFLSALKMTGGDEEKAHIYAKMK